MGGINEVQTINFLNNWTGSFSLAFDNDNNPDTPDLITDPITYNGNTAATASTPSKCALPSSASLRKFRRKARGSISASSAQRLACTPRRCCG